MMEQRNGHYVNHNSGYFQLKHKRSYVTTQRFVFFVLSKNGKRAINGRIYFHVFFSTFQTGYPRVTGTVHLLKSDIMLKKLTPCFTNIGQELKYIAERFISTPLVT